VIKKQLPAERPRPEPPKKARERATRPRRRTAQTRRSEPNTGLWVAGRRGGCFSRGVS
jgi:hypothetical protein